MISWNNKGLSTNCLGQNGKAIPNESISGVVISACSISACDKGELLLHVSVFAGISYWF